MSLDDFEFETPDLKYTYIKQVSKNFYCVKQVKNVNLFIQLKIIEGEKERELIDNENFLRRQCYIIKLDL